MSADPVVSPADTPERDERLMRAIAAADRASTSMTPYGPMNDRWMRGFLDTLAAEGLAIVDAALLAVGERDKAEIKRLRNGCPAGDLCALNGGAIHCYFCRRNWPRDETWEQPFFDRPDLRQDDIETLREARERDRQQIARLTEALERIAYGNVEQRGSYQVSFADASNFARAVLAGEEAAQSG